MKPAKQIAHLRKKLEKLLDEKRMEHTIGVAYTAASLAFVHGYDPHKALLSGMLHDCAKYLDDAQMLTLSKKHAIPVSEAEEMAPSLLHAKLGAFFAATEYDVTDEEILDAIRCHTTGRPGMNLPEKILFVADYIEPNRKELPRIDEIRKEAYTDLDLSILHITEDTLAYLKEKAKTLDPQTAETHAYYRELIASRGAAH
ncbi:MAG: bis(5'-nucleosyl)-tetraphosphatase (symmetrical) YqeK [Lachnospiraceae bacterium]|nr:bis(5'-nucleosyl)-tetraphosphatase (symmetrical) YqeK [Lachnospiraceae bacterium]